MTSCGESSGSDGVRHGDPLLGSAALAERLLVGDAAISLHGQSTPAGGGACLAKPESHCFLGRMWQKLAREQGPVRCWNCLRLVEAKLRQVAAPLALVGQHLYRAPG